MRPLHGPRGGRGGAAVNPLHLRRFADPAGWSSWIGCSYADPSGNLGCPAEKLRNGETFPIWPAVLNAIHRGAGALPRPAGAGAAAAVPTRVDPTPAGVRVRILTNNYETPASPGLLEPVAFLKLAGAEVRQYKVRAAAQPAQRHVPSHCSPVGPARP